MHAIISDVHANREALETVLQDIHERHIDRIICLGDVVGYGAEPEACIDLVQKECDFCLSGNHDYAVLTAPVQFNAQAEEAVAFTRKRLRPNILSLRRRRGRWKWLENLPLRREENDALYVHGSPRNERIEYILPADVQYGNIDKIQEILNMIPRLLFVGHTHAPGIFTDSFQYLDPPLFRYRFKLEPNRKYIINAGSVGQPRDGDSRAGYIIVDGDDIMFCRIPYDIQRTMKKVAAIGPISRINAGRLENGR
jgi:predicted phosphodiesterase